MAEPKTIQSLQVGRGLAALAVVLTHANVAARDFGAGHHNSPLLESGYLGVDFFFVLSGFIIYHSTVGRGRSWRDYAVARVRRVYLPYLPIGVGIALIYTLLPAFSEGTRSWSWLPTLTLLPVSSETALLVAWTLKFEIFFYLLFGCLYFGGVLAPGLIIWAIAIALGAVLGITDFIPLAIINLEFLLGIGIAVLYRQGRGHAAILLAAPLPLTLWLGLGAIRGWSVLVGLSLALTMLPVAQLEERGRFTVPRALTFLGAASYSIYLAHGLAISVAARAVRGLPYLAVVGATMLAGVAGGIVYHLLVERRLLRLAPGDRRHERLTGEEPASPTARPAAAAD